MEGMFLVYIAVMLVGLLFILSLVVLITAVGVCVFNRKTAIWRSLKPFALISLVLGMMLGLMVGYCYQVDLTEREEHAINL